MKILSSSFIKSSSKSIDCPDQKFNEFAFIGRSNVGKSSLINSLTNSKKLAKISGTPGKTLLVNHFLINKKWFLVDLPGYGFARKSKKEKRKIEEIITDYFLNRTNIKLTFVLIDIRLKPQKIDIEFMLWLNQNNIQFKIIFTKADKLNKKEFIENPEKYLEILFNDIGIHPEHFVSSSKSKLGRDEILQTISLEINSTKV
jgi:GTP-binding protein